MGSELFLNIPAREIILINFIIALYLNILTIDYFVCMSLYPFWDTGVM